MTPDHLLEIGLIRAPHGLKGALTIYSNTRPAIGIAGYSFWWLGTSIASSTLYKVEQCWQHGKRILAELQDINTCGQATLLSRMHIWVSTDDVIVGEDEYLWQELIGCSVIEASGNRELGKVIALEEYGAQDILSVRTAEDATQQGEWMLPFIKEVVLNVDMATHCITVHLPEGMDACFTPKS